MQTVDRPERADPLIAADEDLEDVSEVDASPVASDRPVDLAVHPRALERLRASEARHAFLLRLSDALRPLGDPDAIVEEACRLLGEELGADRVYYNEVDEASGTGRIVRDHLRGDSPSLAGVYHLADFGWALPLLRTGRTLAIVDAATSPLVPPADLPAMEAVRIAAFIDVPLVKEGSLMGALCVTESSPRPWAPDELRLVEETAERIREAIERSRAEAALAASEARYRTLLTSIDQAYDLIEVVVDEHGMPVDCRIVDANAAYERQTGLSDVVGKLASELVPGLEGVWAERYGRVAFSGEKIAFEEASPALGRIFDVEAVPVGRREQRQVAILFRDVTEQRSMEAALRESVERLEAALRVKDDFLGLVSHELRTPMTIILGMSRVLAAAEGAGSDRLATDIAEAAERLHELVEGMLLLARVDKAEAEQLLEPTLLHHAAQEVLERLRRRERAPRYELEILDRDAIVEVQRTWLERVIENLAGNAAKYGGPGASIRVVIERDGSRARLRVLDDGPGIDAAEAEQVFEPFYRSPATRECVGGAGLGLAVARRIVELSGGRIWASPRAEGGAEFAFELPLHASEEVAPS